MSATDQLDDDARRLAEPGYTQGLHHGMSGFPEARAEIHAEDE